MPSFGSPKNLIHWGGLADSASGACESWSHGGEFESPVGLTDNLKKKMEKISLGKNKKWKADILEHRFSKNQNQSTGFSYSSPASHHEVFQSWESGSVVTRYWSGHGGRQAHCIHLFIPFGLKAYSSISVWFWASSAACLSQKNAVDMMAQQLRASGSRGFACIACFLA